MPNPDERDAMNRPVPWLWRRVPARSHQAVLLAILLFGSIGSYLLISRWVFGYVEVQGISMHPTLGEGDTRLLHRWQVVVRSPRRGDIVAIRDPMDDGLSVKRVVGMPGERVTLTDGRVHINGAVLPESYLGEPGQTFPVRGGAGEFQVGEASYLVLGDNRLWSLDGREYGPIPRARILGVVHE